MKKATIFLSIGCLLSLSAMANTTCFLAKENNKVIKQVGDCQGRFSPASTFKIALGLMGYDSELFKDETTPEWPFKPEYDPYINVCKSPHNPRTWMRDSCVWYSQILTNKLGEPKFKTYVESFDYGNRDISGDKGKNNGLTHSWLSSSLEISPEEQTIFLKKLIDNQLPVSKKAQEKTKKILFREELHGGWMLYGKTGTGEQWNADKTKKIDLQHGWFIGWIEKNDKIIYFASHLVDDKKEDIPASFRIRDEAKNQLWKIINELEK